MTNDLVVRLDSKGIQSFLTWVLWSIFQISSRLKKVDTLMWMGDDVFVP
jgi:hypothetical protein